jgi:hypothetical protein
MSDKENDILAREMGKFGALGSGWGAKTVAKRLPNNEYELNLEIKCQPQKALETVFNVLSQQGQIIEDFQTPTELPTICATVGSGFFNINPTLIKVQVAPITNETARISIFGTAKEGLIKQKAGEKAVKRIAEILNQGIK